MFIQYERDEAKASQLLEETVAEILKNEDEAIEAELLCLAAR